MSIYAYKRYRSVRFSVPQHDHLYDVLAQKRKPFLYSTCGSANI